MSRRDITDQIVQAKLRQGVSWSELAELIGRPEVWTVAALLGEHPIVLDDAKKILRRLGLDEGEAYVLTATPYRGSSQTSPPTDPTIYRFHEALLVYGPALKELIHEKFGDGIMSAINFSIDVDRKDDPAGDRVLVTMSGKFLAYEWNA